MLRDIATRRVDATFHLGDLVGGGAWPDEVVQRITAERIAGVAGDYDSRVAVGDLPDRRFDEGEDALARQSLEWTLAHVTGETQRFLASLPFRIDHRPLGGHAPGPTLRLVHGSHTSNTVGIGADRPAEHLRQVARGVGARPGDVVAVGHTHVPWAREVDRVTYVNAGSVGQPGDGDPRAGWVLLELTADDVHLELLRVAYDVEAAARAIRARDLPGELAERLLTGGAPSRQHW